MRSNGARTGQDFNILSICAADRINSNFFSISPAAAEFLMVVRKWLRVVKRDGAGTQRAGRTGMARSR
jgi:hypothetical protein